MQQSKSEGSPWVTTTYSLRITLILSSILTASSCGMMSYSIIGMLQATSTNEAAWLKGQVLLWLLWACVLGFQFIVVLSAWKKASPEQKHAPAIGTVPLTWKLLVWQMLMFLAIIGTVHSYRDSHSPGRRVHELPSIGQYESYFSLCLILVWMVAFVLRSRLQKGVT